MEILTFDDQYTLADFGMMNYKGNEQDMFGSISNRTEKIPGRKGLLDFGDEVGSFKEKFPILVKAKNPVERSYQLRAFKKFILDEYGYPRTMKIHKSTEPDVYYWGKASIVPVPELYSNAGSFTLEIINLDGVKYSVTESDEIIWGSEKINFLFNIELGHTGLGASGEQITLNTTVYPSILGDAVQPYFVLNGSGSNIVISCDGKNINVGTFTGNLEIDTANFYAEINGVEKAMKMDKFYLVRGKPLSITGTNMNFKFTNHFRDEF
ncbi:phage tail domain-containing protein [Enterococcus dispar]